MKETNRQPVTLEKASASLVGSAKLASSSTVEQRAVNPKAEGSNPSSSAKQYHFSCKNCMKENHFGILGEIKEVRKVIWSCRCGYKNRVYLGPED